MQMSSKFSPKNTQYFNITVDGYKRHKRDSRGKVYNIFRKGLSHNDYLISNIFKNTVLLNINRILIKFDVKYSELFKKWY